MAVFCVCMTLMGRVYKAASAELQRMDLESMARRNRNFSFTLRKNFQESGMSSNKVGYLWTGHCGPDCCPDVSNAIFLYWTLIKGTTALEGKGHNCRKTRKHRLGVK